MLEMVISGLPGVTEARVNARTIDTRSEPDERAPFWVTFKTDETQESWRAISTIQRGLNLSPGPKVNLCLRSAIGRWFQVGVADPGDLAKALAVASSEDVHPDESDDHWGACPACGGNDGHRNVGRHHWFFCIAHRNKWYVGDNLFSTWREETEDIWEENEQFLADFQQV